MGEERMGVVDQLLKEIGTSSHSEALLKAVADACDEVLRTSAVHLAIKAIELAPGGSIQGRAFSAELARLRYAARIRDALRESLPPGSGT